jgi:V/A-type H+-transporting ATPase subunit E
MEEKGIEEELVALIPKGVNPRAINELLASNVLEKLEKQTVVASDIAGGVQLQLKGQKITIDMSDAVVKELIGQYIRKDLRDLIFNV